MLKIKGRAGLGMLTKTKLSLLFQDYFTVEYHILFVFFVQHLEGSLPFVFFVCQIFKNGRLLFI